jgi:hypothetical protein
MLNLQNFSEDKNIFEYLNRCKTVQVFSGDCKINVLITMYFHENVTQSLIVEI